MKKLRSLVLVAVAALLAAATLHDASWITHALGLPVEGGEAIVALACLVLSLVVFMVGALGMRGQASDRASREG